MARDKTDRTDKTPAATPDGTDRAEIEAALDKVVPDIIARIAKKNAVLGWHLIAAAKIENIKIGSANVPWLPEERAQRLAELAETNPHAFDLASYIAGANIVTLREMGIDLSPPLSVFAARVLMGEVKRPPQPGRPRAETMFLRLWQYGFCRFIAATTPLYLSRNDEPGRQRVVQIFSACDAVAQAFKRAGKNTSYSQMKSLCYDAAHRDIRELAEHLGVLEV